MNALLILLGKLFSIISRFLNVGSGSTWPGHIALNLNKSFIKDIIKQNSHVKVILIAGTNGKTTTGKLIQTILEKSGKKVFQNESGANLLNGIASSLVLHSAVVGKLNYDFAIFEIDENTLPLILKVINNPDFVIILNLFRDQLDRYGEVNIVAANWKMALRKLSSKTKIILNADDPQVVFLGENIKSTVLYFGIDSQKNKSQKYQHASDSTYCPNCGKKLIYKSTYFSHLGDWSCESCKFKQPSNIFINASFYPLPGMYNEYNTNAATLLSKELGIEEKDINSALRDFKPAFGRQEILNVDGKKVQIFLSKNPTSLNESLKTISSLNAKNLLIVLNDRIPDGRDVSWIWDADTEEYIKNFNYMIVSGDRAFDMGLRIKYSYSSEFPISNFQFPVNSQFSKSKFQIIENLKDAISAALKVTPKNETLYILPTYSGMLEVRKMLTGRKIM